jgi:hypothetical protein
MKEIAIAVVSLIVGAIVGPYINWGIEKRKLLLAHRRELVAQWRKMLFEISQRQVQTAEPIVHMLELYEAFYSLKPHLRPDVIDRLGLTDNIKGQAFETIQKSEALIADIITPGRPLKNSSTFRLLTDEVARIEKQWELI